jgi:hypothetical protein
MVVCVILRRSFQSDGYKIQSCRIRARRYTQSMPIFLCWGLGNSENPDNPDFNSGPIKIRQK